MNSFSNNTIRRFLSVALTWLCVTAVAAAEIHTLTLKQAVAIALKQNYEVVISRLDEQRARAGVRIAKDPFVPKVYGGSGLAYTSGYPNSIEGSAPSIFTARTDMALFNRPKAYELAEARENARGAAFDSANKADDISLRAASLFLDTEQLRHLADSLQEEIQALDRVNAAVRLRVGEGRELPLAGKRSELDLARARQRFEAAAYDLDYGEESLAVILGLPAGDRVRTSDEDETPAELPASEDVSIATALENNKDIKRIQSQMQAKAFAVRSQQAQRLPQFDLVAQYSLFAKYNYQDFFRTFQRNNVQLGVAIKLPLLIGSAPEGLRAQAEVDLAKLRAQVNEVRTRTTLETRRSYQDVQRAGSARDFAKLDLDVAREQVRVLLDQLDEGRSTRQSVDEARMLEQEKWISYYDSQHVLEKARLVLLKQTGTIQAALR